MTVRTLFRRTRPQNDGLTATANRNVRNGLDSAREAGHRSFGRSNFGAVAGIPRSALRMTAVGEGGFLSADGRWSGRRIQDDSGRGRRMTAVGEDGFGRSGSAGR